MKIDYRNIVVNTLAIEFSRRLRKCCDTVEVARRNYAEKDPNVCHSHDFCDANMEMQDAFEHVVGRKPDSNVEEDEKLWADAWDLAKSTRFDHLRPTYV